MGISQLQYWNFEVVVVADPAGIRAAEALHFAPDLKLVPFDEPNISAARNLGILHAAGDIVAFIDDDAVPEPMWLRHLTAPASRPDVAAMGGYVRGRNGISFQWKAAGLDMSGRAYPLGVDPQQATVMTPPKGRAIKTEGTNMAFRRDVLVELMGFDPAFHYFLDETDLNVRLARAGYATAIVPLAEVHHGYAENHMRGAARVPKDLFDIGASWAVFQRKHMPPPEHIAHWQDLRLEQRQRLLRFMQSGALEPRDVPRLIARLDQGYAEGRERVVAAPKLPKNPAAPFHRFPSIRREAVLLQGRPLRAAGSRARAMASVNKGHIVTLIILSRSALFHRTVFDKAGFWVQTGGLFGKADRTERILSLYSRKSRVKKEIARIELQRGYSRAREQII